MKMCEIIKIGGIPVHQIIIEPIRRIYNYSSYDGYHMLGEYRMTFIGKNDIYIDSIIIDEYERNKILDLSNSGKGRQDVLFEYIANTYCDKLIDNKTQKQALISLFGDVL